MTVIELGGGFQMGTAAPLDLSLDEMIKSRAKAAVKKPISNVDRSIGTSRARRDAAVSARRGLSQSSKPTPMQIEAAVQKQANQTAIQTAVQQKKKTTFATTASLTLKEKAALRKQQRDIQVAGKKAAAAEHVALPSKKMLKVARAALIQAGYIFPPRYEVKVVGPTQPPTTIPGVGNSSNKNSNTTTKKNPPPNNNNNNNRNSASQQQQQQPKKRNPNNRRRGGNMME